MRVSPLKHTLAVLRTTIGLTQKELADLVGRAPRTIQAVELGQLPMSEELAMCVAQATGVNVGWLMDNNTSAKPQKGLTALGLGSGKGEYTRSDYELHRAFAESPALTDEDKRKIAEINTDLAPEYITIPVSTMALLLRAQKKKLLQQHDEQTLSALKGLLESTIATDVGDLIRWKTRRFLLTLAEDNRIKLDLEAAPDMSFMHIHVVDESDDSPKRSRKKKS